MYKNRIQNNNDELQDILDTINNLPSGSGEDNTEILTEQAELIQTLKTVLENKSSVEVTLQEKAVTPLKMKQEVTADDGYDGLSKVTLEPIPSYYIVPSGTKEITTNGDHDVKKFDSVEVDIQPNLQEKTATENGEVIPDTGYDGLSKVIVDVASSGSGVTIAQFVDSGLNGMHLKITEADLQGVESIIRYAFYGKENVDQITLPETVFRIGNEAFAKSYISSLTIPSKVSRLETGLFRECPKLTSITIPSTVTEMYGEIFYRSALKEIIFEDGEPFSYLGSNLFAYTAFTSITLPNRFTYIPRQIFSNCSTLKTVVCDGNITKIDDYAFNYCTALEVLDLSKVTAVPTLGSYVFQGISTTFQIRVPSALVNEWKASTNWSAHASKIVGV